MARFDYSAQQQQQQFVTQLKSEYQMHRERLANNLRVAQAQASSQRELQSIQNAHAMQMMQLKQQFQMQASQFAQAQQNARQSKLLQTYDKWKQAGYKESQLDQIMKAIESIQGAIPQDVLGGEPPPSIPGTGSWSYGGGGYTERPSYEFPLGHSLTPSLDWRERMRLRNEQFRSPEQRYFKRYVNMR
jgi:hypothetical protein